ncbi:venom serine protease-like [Wyeomyia smithii]|uniref:venom serine protease-like n=1 Tax=Wyeomyia smithii TaxID=174621 RepID=UPI002467DF12|nr:venom serine protease-like [Wyeomyia smithii]
MKRQDVVQEKKQEEKIRNILFGHPHLSVARRGLCVAILLSSFCPIQCQFASCDNIKALKADETFYIQSPNYSGYYKANTNCRWKLSAPVGYVVYLNCYDVILPASTNCAADRIEVSLVGNALLSGASRYCGQSTFILQSTANQLSLALRTLSTSTGGRFRCQVVARKLPCDCGRRKTVKIVNGTPTLVNEFPMVAGLVSITGRNVFCGATIVSNRHALTAAHCLTGRQISATALLVGDHDLSTGTDTPYAKLMVISTFTIHSAYRAQPSANDIALVRTRDEIQFTNGVGPACLPWIWPTATFNNMAVEAAGWGTLDFGGQVSNVLQKVTLNVVSYESCRQQMSSSSITQNQLCTYAPNRDACQYDSGGPILYTNPNNGIVYHIGVISYGIACAGKTPGVNTRITSYLAWIKSNTVGIDYCEK